MTEIQQYEEPTTQVDVHQSVAINTIHQTAVELADAHKIASAICTTKFVPEHFRGKPEETAVGILYGATVGFDPLTAVQQIYVIGGKPALYARAMVAIVLKAGHQIWTEEEKPGLVTVAGQRAGSDKITRVTWTTELAKQAGYDKNPKYRSDPRSMLYARASGDVARRIAPDALLGLAYNVEEMQLVRTVESTPVRATQSSRDRVAAAISGPRKAEPADDTSAEPEGDVELLSDRQSKKLHASFNEIGLTDRDARMAYTVHAVGRDISSSSELTKAEAASLIDALDAEIAMRAAADQEPVDDVLEDRRREIVETAEAMGRNMWAVESAFAEQHDGATFVDASIEQLDAFLAWVREQAA